MDKPYSIYYRVSANSDEGSSVAVTTKPEPKDDLVTIHWENTPKPHKIDWMSDGRMLIDGVEAGGLDG